MTLMPYDSISAREIEEYRDVTLARDGYRCNICKKSIDQLIIIAQAREIITNATRKHPVLVIDHVNGNERQRDGADGTYCANLQLACYTCNKVKLNEINLEAADANLSREKRDSTKGEHAFHRNLKTFLIDSDHICFEEVKMSAKHLSDNVVKETAVLRYFISEIVNRAHPDAIYQEFPFACSNENCTGTHYCLRGMKPEILIDQEKQKIQNQYNNKYANGNKIKYNSHTSSLGRPFVPFAEFYNKLALLGNHKFV